MLVAKYSVLILALGGMVACSASYRKESLGTGRLIVSSSEASPAATAQGVRVSASRDKHEVSFEITTPRAMKLRYLVHCPGGDFRGDIGERWERYEGRRLRELERAREQEVNTKAAIVGAVVGKAQASTQAQAGPVAGEVHAEVDGRAAGQVLAESTTAKAKLPAWDVGAQRLRHTVRIPGAAGGVCTLRVWPHDEAQSVAGVQGQFTVTRLVDKAQEKARVKHQRNLVAEQKALVLRGELKAKLVAGGADPQYREKTRRAREARELEEKRQLEI